MSKLKTFLPNWRILRRFDALGKPEMGMIIIVPKETFNEVSSNIETFTDCPLFQGETLLIQGIKVKFLHGLEIGFIYCRKSPTVKLSKLWRAMEESGHVVKV